MLEPLEPGEFEGHFDLFSIFGTLEPNLRYADDSVLYRIPRMVFGVI